MVSVEPARSRRGPSIGGLGGTDEVDGRDTGADSGAWRTGEARADYGRRVILLPVAAALAGLVIGFRMRDLIARYSSAEGESSRPGGLPSPVVPAVVALALGALALRAVTDRLVPEASFPPEVTWVGELLAFCWLAVIAV